MAEEREAIVEAVQESDRSASVFLFGSRVDDNTRGGDIDVLIVSDRISSSELLDIENYVFDRIDEQKIDFVLTTSKLENPFARLIMKKGRTVRL